jgi:hypothetical protein
MTTESDEPEPQDGLSIKKELGIYLRVASTHLENPDRWPISREQRERMVSRAMDIVERSKDGRAVTKAMLVLAKLDEINLQARRDEQGTKVNVDITSGGRGIGDLSRLSDAELEAKIQALQAAQQVTQLPPIQ